MQATLRNSDRKPNSDRQKISRKNKLCRCQYHRPARTANRQTATGVTNFMDTDKLKRQKQVSVYTGKFTGM